MYQSFLWVLILFWVIFYEISTKIYFLAEILAFFSLEECGDEGVTIGSERYFYYHYVYKMPGHLPGHLPGHFSDYIL